jgi:thiamine monophosphate kinase
VAAVAGGDDYELLFAVPARRRRAFFSAMRLCHPLGVTRVGRLTKGPGLALIRAGVPGALSFGFRHFQA